MMHALQFSVPFPSERTGHCSTSYSCAIEPTRSTSKFPATPIKLGEKEKSHRAGTNSSELLTSNNVLKSSGPSQERGQLNGLQGLSGQRWPHEVDNPLQQSGKLPARRGAAGPSGKGRRDSSEIRTRLAVWAGRRPDGGASRKHSQEGREGTAQASTSTGAALGDMEATPGDVEDNPGGVEETSLDQRDASGSQGEAQSRAPQVKPDDPVVQALAWHLQAAGLGMDHAQRVAARAPRFINALREKIHDVDQLPGFWERVTLEKERDSATPSTASPDQVSPAALVSPAADSTPPVRGNLRRPAVPLLDRSEAASQAGGAGPGPIAPQEPALGESPRPAGTVDGLWVTKVGYFLAKRGGGLFPYLESVGVRTEQIPRVARVAAGQPLVEVVEKVEWLENLLQPRPPPLAADGSPPSPRPEPKTSNYSNSSQLRWMVRRLTVDPDEELQAALAFLQKMEAERGGLSVLDLPSSATARLLEGFPQLLTRSLPHALTPTLRFLQEELAVPAHMLPALLLSFPQVLLGSPSPEEINARLRPLKKVGVRASDLGRVAGRYPWVLSRSVLGNLDAVVAFMTKIKVPLRSIERALTGFPGILGSSVPLTMEPAVRVLEGFGVRSKRLGWAIAESPQLLAHSAREFREVTQFLEGLCKEGANRGGYPAEVVLPKVLVRAPAVLVTSVPHTLTRKVEYLRQLGIADSHFGRILHWYPEVLLAAVGTMEARLRYLESRGLSRRDVQYMVRYFPPLLGYNVETVLQPKLDFLVHEMGRSIQDVVTFPKFFSYHLEKRLRPRLLSLKRRNIVDVDLATVFNTNDADFGAELTGVEPFSVKFRETESGEGVEGPAVGASAVEGRETTALQH